MKKLKKWEKVGFLGSVGLALTSPWFLTLAKVMPDGVNRIATVAFVASLVLAIGAIVMELFKNAKHS